MKSKCFHDHEVLTAQNRSNSCVKVSERSRERAQIFPTMICRAVAYRRSPGKRLQDTSSTTVDLISSVMQLARRNGTKSVAHPTKGGLKKVMEVKKKDCSWMRYYLVWFC